MLVNRAEMMGCRAQHDKATPQLREADSVLLQLALSSDAAGVVAGPPAARNAAGFKAPGWHPPNSSPFQGLCSGRGAASWAAMLGSGGGQPSEQQLVARLASAQASLAVSAAQYVLQQPMPLCWCLPAHRAEHQAPPPLPTRSAQEPYWHRSSLARPAQQRRGVPDASEAVRLKKQLAVLSKDFSGLLANHERADAQLQDLQTKIRLLRQELASKDKALDLSRRTIDRLTQEKTQHEVRRAAGLAGAGSGAARLGTEGRCTCPWHHLSSSHLSPCCRPAWPQTRRTSASSRRACSRSRMWCSCRRSAPTSGSRWAWRRALWRKHAHMLHKCCCLP